MNSKSENRFCKIFQFDCFEMHPICLISYIYTKKTRQSPNIQRINTLPHSYRFICKNCGHFQFRGKRRSLCIMFLFNVHRTFIHIFVLKLLGKIYTLDNVIPIYIAWYLNLLLVYNPSNRIHCTIYGIWIPKYIALFHINHVH